MSSSYPAAPSYKPAQIKKIVLKDVIAIVNQVHFHILQFTPLSINKFSLKSKLITTSFPPVQSDIQTLFG